MINKPTGFLKIVCLAALLANACDQKALTDSFSEESPALGFDFVYTGDNTNRNVEVWSEVLRPMAGKPDLRYLEVGVWEGRSLVWMMQNILSDPTSTATAVDLFTAEIDEVFDHNMAVAGLWPRVTKVKGYSRIVLRNLPVGTFDLIYIDGSHAGTDVLTDAVLCWDLLKVDGIMVFDDYVMDTARHRGAEGGMHMPAGLRPGVAIDALLTVYSQHIEILHDGYQMIIRKIRPSCLTAPTGGSHERIKHCSAFGDYVYYWNRRTLYRAEDAAEVPLSEDEVEAVEALLAAEVRWRSPRQVPLALAEDPDHAAILARLGLEP